MRACVRACLRACEPARVTVLPKRDTCLCVIHENDEAELLPACLHACVRACVRAYLHAFVHAVRDNSDGKKGYVLTRGSWK